MITPERGVRVVDGLLTGWHEPEASHLQMLEAVAGRELLERSYAAALDEGYLWHEFGDVHLILPADAQPSASTSSARTEPAVRGGRRSRAGAGSGPHRGRGRRCST